jgi:sporulation protein YabP
MEEKEKTLNHRVLMTNRQSGSFSGVVDVLSFDVNEILLETGLGMLLIKGKELHVNRLSLEKGEVELSGQIDAISYSKVPDQRKESLMARLFR